MINQSFSIVAGRMAGLLALAWLGWILVRREHLAASAANSLAQLVVDVTLPALIFVGMTSFSATELAWQGLAFAGVAVSLLGLALAWPFARLKNIENKGTFLFLVAVANSSFLPLPLATALWGEQGTQACLIYILGNNLFLLSGGIALLGMDREKSKKDYISTFFMHPQMLAAVTGLLWRWTGFAVPSWGLWTLKSLGDSTIPLAMLAIGGLMAGQTPNTVDNKWILGVAGALKLLALPLLVLLILKVTGIKGVFAGVVLLQASMPSLASAAAYAARFGGDPVLAGKGSFWTSLGALGTLPAFLSLGAALGLF